MLRFSAAERRGVLWLLPLLAVAGVLIAFASRPAYEQSFLDLADRIEQDSTTKKYYDRTPVTNDGAYSYNAEPEPASAPELFAFDPNTVSLQELCRLGFDVRTATGIIKYREKGKRFEIPEDFATCYGVSLAQYTRLEPYIKIGEQYRARPREFSREPKDTVRRDYVAAADSVRPRERKPREIVELNSADSAALRSVSGIGEVMVGRIVEYRRRLGGFARVEQLAEIEGMTEQNYERICKQIRVDNCEIQKIDINFEPHKTLAEWFARHPYTTDKMLRKLLKARQLRGGWRTPEDLVKENILTHHEAERLAPYLVFGVE